MAWYDGLLQGLDPPWRDKLQAMIVDIFGQTDLCGPSISAWGKVLQIEDDCIKIALAHLAPTRGLSLQIPEKTVTLKVSLAGILQVDHWIGFHGFRC